MLAGHASVVATEYEPKALAGEEGVVGAERAGAEHWVENNSEDVELTLWSGLLPALLKTPVKDAACRLIEPGGVAVGVVEVA